MKSARPRILRKITAAMLRNSSKVGYVVQRKYQAELLPALIDVAAFDNLFVHLGVWEWFV